jgi:hypothetical protein
MADPHHRKAHWVPWLVAVSSIVCVVCGLSGDRTIVWGSIGVLALVGAFVALAHRDLIEPEVRR